MDRTKEYNFVLSTMPRLHARPRLLELGVFNSETRSVVLSMLANYTAPPFTGHGFNMDAPGIPDLNAKRT